MSLAGIASAVSDGEKWKPCALLESWWLSMPAGLWCRFVPRRAMGRCGGAVVARFQADVDAELTAGMIAHSAADAAGSVRDQHVHGHRAAGS